MGSDIARKTADAAQQYRAVVWQQGRVTLETDLNEAEEMRAEQSHAQLLDIVGPAGTPDDGYRVSVPATSGIPYDFSIGFGTFYMGGVRVSRAAATSWFGQQQGDWLDLAAELQDQPEREQVLLWLQEQEVSAVEDAALREEALGGPDTAQRLRLLQRVLRQPVEADDCAGAFGEIAQRWAKEGLVLDQATRRLGSAARLKAGFQQPGGSMSPCEPQAQGGFLGAENQLIRVQVTAGSKILWGFDNASFLYRVTPVGGSKKVLRLGSVPVDAQHQPRTGQYVEVLRPTALLANGELVAAPSGHVSKLSGGYDPDAETVQLETSLPAGYLEAEQLYLRVWEEQKQFDENVPLTLGDTGLQVTLSGGPFPLGDHWLLAVRPSQPQRVYPARYLEEPQPPDGPRCWATPLALLNWKDEDTAEVVDCRPAFDNLVELTARPLAQPGSSGGGCCSVIIGPEDLVGESLQEIIDRYSREYRPAVICLRTGRYELEEPLRLGKEHDGLALHGCTGEVVLAAAEGKEESFADGLVVIYGTKEITLSSLRFELPAAPLDLQALGMDEAAARELQRALDEQGAGLYVSIGVQVAKTSGLTIEGCVFGYSSKKGLVFAVGVLLRGGAEALRVEGCQFLESKSQQGSEVFSIGIMGAASFRPEQAVLSSDAAFEATVDAEPFDGLVVKGCTFRLGYVAVWLVGVLGKVQLKENTVYGCLLFGFNLTDVGGRISESSVNEAPARENEYQRGMAEHAVLAGKDDPRLAAAEVVFRQHRVPEAVLARSKRITVVPGVIKREEKAEFNKYLASCVARPEAGMSEERIRGFPRIIPRVVERRHPADKLQERLVLADREMRRVVGPSTVFRSTIVENEIHAGMFAVVLSSSSNPKLDSSEVVFANNQVSSGAVLIPTVVISMIRKCSINGNVIANHFDGFHSSLWVLSPDRAPLAAITGNVLVGAAILPNRPSVPTPMNQWIYFNSCDQT